MTLLKEGRLSRFDYTEIDHCCQNFSLVDGWLEQYVTERRRPGGVRRRELVRSSDVISVGHGKFNKADNISTSGVDEECDDAQLSPIRGIK